MKKKYIKIKAFVLRGSSEILGFMSTLPILTFLIVAVISIYQNGLVMENLEYTAYCACRAAVVCEDKKTAEYKAELAANESMRYTNAMYTMPKGASKMTKLEIITADDKESNWKKGNYIRCTVTVHVDTMTPFVSGEKTSAIVMMIERPAENDLKYILG